MNKDAILATIIGFFIGLAITGLILVGPKLLSGLPKFSFKFPSMNQSQTKPKPTPTKTAAFTVTIDSPQPESIESETDLLVSGTTGAGATVVIQSNSSDDVVAVKKDGKYAGKVTLVEGKNEVSVTSYLNHQTATKTVSVYYTSEQL